MQSNWNNAYIWTIIEIKIIRTLYCWNIIKKEWGNIDASIENPSAVEQA